MFTVELKADTLNAGLAELDAHLSDWTPVMEQIGEYLVKSTKERFAKGESPEGAKWAPKSAATLARYGARKSNRVDRRPLFGPSGALSSQIFHEAGPMQVAVGSNLIYAAVQQFGAGKGAFGNMANGSPIPWGNIPARPFLGLSPEDETNILALVVDYLGLATTS